HSLRKKVQNSAYVLLDTAPYP
ncbi:uncharacterized protein METZ01_LOCUS171983, partial [marine metagenome]